MVAMSLPAIAIMLASSFLVFPLFGQYLMTGGASADFFIIAVAYSVVLQLIIGFMTLFIYVKWGLALPYVSVRAAGHGRTWSAPEAIAPQFWSVFWATAIFTLLQIIAAILLALVLLPVAAAIANGVLWTALAFIGAGILSHAYLLLAPDDGTI